MLQLGLSTDEFNRVLNKVQDDVFFPFDKDTEVKVGGTILLVHWNVETSRPVGQATAKIVAGSSKPLVQDCQQAYLNLKVQVCSPATALDEKG
ncbi:MAG: hypothetical protein AAB701_02435 [Patescibacteria group bacterium]